MSRGLLPGLPTPHPIGAFLPALYQRDDFAQRFTEGLDEIIAPVLATLDNLHAYFDPLLTADDFVPWLAGWVGLLVEDGWAPEQLRALVTEACELYRWRGTVRGLARLVEVFTGATPEIDEPGGATASVAPGSALPGRRGFDVTVRLPAAADARAAGRVEALVAAAVPAHVIARVEWRPAS